VKNRTTDVELLQTIKLLKEKTQESGVPLWRSLAKKFERSNKRRIYANISLINRHSKPNDIVVIPGKVLGSGKLDHPVNVSAFRFSKIAKQKIEDSGGRCISFSTLLSENPKVSMVRMLG
jgi:large subunit ribosomal protein L18e